VEVGEECGELDEDELLVWSAGGCGAGGSPGGRGRGHAAGPGGAWAAESGGGGTDCWSQSGN